MLSKTGRSQQCTGLGAAPCLYLKTALQQERDAERNRVRSGRMLRDTEEGLLKPVVPGPHGWRQDQSQIQHQPYYSLGRVI